MKPIYLLSLATLLIFNSCSNEEQVNEKVEEKSVEEENEWTNLQINDGGYKLSIEVPNEKLGQGIGEAVYLEDIGELEVRVGQEFDLFILEDQSQLEMIKNELSDHPFYKVEFTVANDSSLLYRQYTENGGEEQWHVYAERNIGSTILLIRSNEAIPFTEYRAKLMLQSALSITPL